MHFNPRAAQSMFDTLFVRLEALELQLDSLQACCEASSPDPEPATSSHPCADGSVEFGGYAYATQQYGTKTWFVENLITKTYANGDTIPDAVVWTEWSALTTGARYDMDTEANALLYGRLYNFHAIMDERGLCPIGWHVSTDQDWQDLGTVLGGLSQAGEEVRGTSESHVPWDGTNTSCFGAVPNGYRYDNPSDPSVPAGSDGWDHGSLDWTSPQGWSTACYWAVGPSNASNIWLIPSASDAIIAAGYRTPTHGLGIRCVQD